MAGHGSVSKREMARVDARSLLYVSDQSASSIDDDGFICISQRELASHLGLSLYRAQMSLRRLATAGMLEVTSLHGENGSQLANGYRITDAGNQFLRGYLVGLSTVEASSR